MVGMVQRRRAARAAYYVALARKKRPHIAQTIVFQKRIRPMQLRIATSKQL